jgi:hypothetical protein
MTTYDTLTQAQLALVADEPESRPRREDTLREAGGRSVPVVTALDGNPSDGARIDRAAVAHD